MLRALPPARPRAGGAGLPGGVPRGPAAALVVLGALWVALVLLLLPEPVLPGAAAQQAALQEVREALPGLSAREDAFHAALRPWTLLSLATGLVLAGLLGLTPLGARLVARLPGSGRRGGWALQVVLGVAVVLVLSRLVRLPLSAAAEAVLREYGLSTRTWVGWAGDVGRGLLVDTALTTLVVLPVVALARRTRLWWAWGAGVAAVLVAAASFAYPLVVEPVFNDFQPLERGALRTELLALAEADGVAVDDVLVADASRRTTALNAYVSGYGASRRIVVYDTLLEGATPQEVALVVAHELGHADEDDVLAGTVLGAVGAAVGVCLLALLLSWRPLLRRAGATGPGDPRVVALLLALSAVGTLLSAPLVNGISRRVEARADAHALALTGDPETFVATQLRLAETNLADLDPPLVWRLWFGSHPTTPQRVALARELP